MGKIVAIDYGKKRIGIAYADEKLKIALSYLVIEQEKELSKTIAKLIDTLQPIYQDISFFVLGLPLLLSGKESAMAVEVQRFGKMLEDKTQIKVRYFDERLTSAKVEKEWKNLHITRKKRAKKIDAAAACVLLQDFLLSM